MMLNKEEREARMAYEKAKYPYRPNLSAYDTCFELSEELSRAKMAKAEAKRLRKARAKCAHANMNDDFIIDAEVYPQCVACGWVAPEPCRKVSQ